MLGLTKCVFITSISSVLLQLWSGLSKAGACSVIWRRCRRLVVKGRRCWHKQ